MRTFIVFLLLSGIFNIGCNGNKSVSEDQDTSHPDQSLYEQASSLLSNAKTDSILHPEAIAELYDKKEFHTVWSADTQFLPRTDTFIQFLKNCWQEGLFAEDYHAATLIRNVQMVEKDSAAMLNPATWVKIDLQLTGALLAVYTDLKQGRLVTDSLRYFNLPKSFGRNFILLSLNPK